MLNKKNQLIAVVVVLVIFIAGAGYWYFGAYRQNQVRLAFQKDAAEAEAFHNAGRRDESIPAFQNALMEAPTKINKTQVKLEIAFDLFRRNQGDDQAKAVAMYKEIISDSSVLPLQRALAVSDFLDIYNGNQDGAFARENIFKGAPLGKFLDEARSSGYQSDNNSDVAYAVRKSYELAETFYPLSLSEFRIAGWYSGALNSGSAQSDSQKQEFLSQLKAWTQKGEYNLPFTLRVGYEKSKIGYTYQMDALARRTLAKYTDQDYSSAENLFERGLQALLPEDAVGDGNFNINAYTIGLYIRLAYAAMLADAYGDKRKTDIVALLQPIINPAPELKNSHLSFYEYLRNETGHSHDTHGHKKDIVRLINLIPSFKEALSARGIVY